MTRSNSYRAFLPLDPLPCPRPKVAVIRGHGVAYYPKSYKTWVEEFVKLFEGKQLPNFEGPVRVRICCDIQKAKTSKLITPTGDVDNYAKSVMDGLTKVGMWDDDKQVVSLLVIKRFVPFDPVVNNAGIHLYIRAINP